MNRMLQMSETKEMMCAASTFTTRFDNITAILTSLHLPVICSSGCFCTQIIAKAFRMQFLWLQLLKSHISNVEVQHYLYRPGCPQTAERSLAYYPCHHGTKSAGSTGCCAWAPLVWTWQIFVIWEENCAQNTTLTPIHSHKLCLCVSFNTEIMWFIAVIRVGSNII